MTIKDMHPPQSELSLPAFDRMAVTSGNMAWSQGTMNAKKNGVVNGENIQALKIKAANASSFSVKGHLTGSGSGVGGT